MSKLSQSRYLFLVDVLLVLCSTLLAIYVLPQGKERMVTWGVEGIAIFAFVWFGLSFLFKKYSSANQRVWRRHIFLSNLLIVLILMAVAYWATGLFFFSKGIYLLFVLITAVELLFFRGLEEVSRATEVGKADRYFRRRKLSQAQASKKAPELAASEYLSQDIRAMLEEERGAEVADYLSDIEPFEHERVLALRRDSAKALQHFNDASMASILLIRRLNNTFHLNDLLHLVNTKLSHEGHLVCCVELKNTRKKRILSRYPWGLNWCFYTVDYIFKRIFPKLRLTKGLYFLLTKGYNRIFTYTEVLGRMYASGFELMSRKQIGNLHYLQLRKVAEADKLINTNYGLLIKLSRVGKGGKMINVYKLRTMHPYSEYIQAYVYQHHGTKTGDKLEHDFRVNTTGHLLRRFWIDEWPMLLNLLKGELKLVGVRPLSRHKFETYPRELQEKRIKTTPGLVPPFYADMPKKEEELWSSELRYLERYFKHPLRTDWQYFWKAFYNIVLKGARSS